MDCIVHGVTESDTTEDLSLWFIVNAVLKFLFQFHNLLLLLLLGRFSRVQLYATP